MSDSRKRKGKAPMTAEQLEMEERKKKKKEDAQQLRQVTEDEKERANVRTTQLSGIIRDLLQPGRDTTHLPGPSHFSWDSLQTYGLPRWPSLHSPLPPPQDQGDDGYCIAFAIYHLLQMQANIAATFRQIDVPNICLVGLVDLLETLPLKRRHIYAFLSLLERHLPTKVNTHGKVTIDYSYGFGRDQLSSANLLFESMKYAIKNFGGILVEYQMILSADEGGGDAKKNLGHVVVAFGWEVDDEGELDFICLNSWGSDDAICLLFKDLNVNFMTIHHIYVPQLRFL